MTSRRQFVGLGLVAATALRSVEARAAKPEKVLRAVMQSDLKIVDPLWTTAYISRNHGYMIYDTLFAMDEHGAIQPQMIDHYEASGDGLSYGFTLRAGLPFHDGTMVKAEDAVASIRRWGQRDTMGQLLMQYVDAIEVKDELGFEIRLKKPYGLLLQSLGKPSSNVLFVMPKRVADTPASEQISDYTGSGPFVFDAKKWKPGAIAVYNRFDDYKPRAEAPSWGAGGKIVNLRRVEWVYIPDQQTAMNALLAGEIDMIEQPPIDLVPTLEDDDDTVLFDQNTLGYQFFFRFNSLWPPFDNAKIRAAAAACFNQEDFLKATIGDPKYYETCPAMFICDTPLATPDGGTQLLKSDFARSKALLKEAGYDGTPVLLMQSTDLAVLTNLAPVAKQLLERGGFKVNMVSMDWQTLVARRARRVSPKEGGWNAFLSSWTSADVLNPIVTAMLNATGDTGYLGWFKDDRLEQMKRQFAEATDLEARKAIAHDIQVYALQTLVTHVYLGQYKVPTALRSGIKGMLQGPAPYFWNIDKEA